MASGTNVTETVQPVSETTESAVSASRTIAGLVHTAEQCLKRCAQSAYPSAEREVRIEAARRDVEDVRQRAALALEDLTREARSEVQATTIELEAAQAELRSLQEANGLADSVYQLARAEIIPQLSGPSGQDAAIRKRLDELDSAHNIKKPARQASISVVQDRVSALVQRLNALNAKFEREAVVLRSQPCPAPLAKIVDEAKALVDKVGQLEQDVGVRAGAALVKEAKAQFADNATAFSAAEEFHKDQARFLFWSMLIIGAVACGLIYVLFVRAEASFSTPGPTTPGGLAIFERIVLIGTGRVALLVMTGLSLKYIARLHQMHAEQSVIYRDRLAALGIAGNLLNATPELAQRREMLKSLMDVYLKFDDSAFGKHRKDAQIADEVGGIDSQIKRVKALTEAISPLLEPVSKALDKAKDKAK